MSHSATYQLASAIKAQWRDGGLPDARRAFAEYPELAHVKSLAVDLAYEEYCQRTSAGEDLAVDEYCQRFSRIRTSLHNRLEVHDFLDTNVDLLNGFACEAWPEIDDSICGFRLLEELGRGAIGRVFLAEEAALANRHVVIKLTRAGLREAETLSRLKHAHIVPIYSIHEEQLSGLTAICMPFLSRWTLQDFLDVSVNNGQLPRMFSQALTELQADEQVEKVSSPDRLAKTSYHDGVLEVLLKLCDALTHTHQRGILHLDIKPSNILLTPVGEPLLLDFNLSIAGAARSSLVGGTMPYMSPEQIQAFVLHEAAEAQSIDHRSDVYSLGIVGYQLLTGHYPFRQLNWKRLSSEVANELFEMQRCGAMPAHERNPKLNKAVSEAIAKAISFSPDDRFQSAAEFAATLRALLSSRGRWQRYAHVHRRAFLAGGAGLSFMTILGAWGLASRESTVDRETRLGWQHFNAGENEAALACFNRVIDIDAKNDAAWFGRGRSHQRLGDFLRGYDDFVRAHEIRPEGKYSACSGYCALKHAYHVTADRHFNEAIHEGFDAVVISRLMGHCFPADKAKAEGCLRRAMTRNPVPAIVWFDLAMLLRTQPGRLSEAIESIEKAIASEDVTHEMCEACAVMAYMNRKDDPQWLDKVRHAMRQAFELGAAFDEYSSLPFLKNLEGDPLLNKLKSRQIAGDRPFSITDPLGDAAISRAALARPR